jgi:hypothetical protein
MDLKNRTKSNDSINNNAVTTSNKSTQKYPSCDLISGELDSYPLESALTETLVEDVKMTAIAVKLADMKATQDLLISSDQDLLTACLDRNISKRLASLLRDDQKNLGIINTAIMKYGIKVEPRLAVVKMIELAKEAMVSSTLSLFEKVAKHELLNHSQEIAGILIYKSAQIVGADIAVMIAPLNTVNFDNHNHQYQLKGIMEMLITAELTEKETDQSLWTMVQDAIAVVSNLAEDVVNHAKT